MLINELIINKPTIIIPNPTKTWRLHIEAMSGDADEFKTLTKDFKHDDTVFEVYLNMCLHYFNDKFNKYDDSFNKILKRYEKDILKNGTAAQKAICVDPKDEYSEDLVYTYTDLIGTDVTNPERNRALQKIWVTWFDESGREFEVKFPSNIKTEE